MIQRDAEEYGKFEIAVDVGTGTGNTQREMAPWCEHVYGVDLADFALKHVRDKGLPKNTFVVQGDALRLPFKSDSTDLVVSNGVMDYLSPDEAKAYIQEIHRILKNGGKYYFSVLLDSRSPEVLESAKTALLDIVARMAFGGGHPDSLSLRSYNDLILATGFRISGGSENQPNNTLAIEYMKYTPQ